MKFLKCTLAITVLLFILAPMCLGQASVHSKTLRDEAQEKGFAKHSEWDDLPLHEPHTLEQLVKRSDLIVVGQVINKASRLSPDDSTVLTDCTIEVSEVLKDSRQNTGVPSEIVVTRRGGTTTVEGKPVEVKSVTFPNIPERAKAIFFIVRPEKPNGWWNAEFSLGDFGVWLFGNDAFLCTTNRKRTVAYTSEQCGKSFKNVVGTITSVIAETRG